MIWGFALLMCFRRHLLLSMPEHTLLRMILSPAWMRRWLSELEGTMLMKVMVLEKHGVSVEMACSCS